MSEHEFKGPAYEERIHKLGNRLQEVKLIARGEKMSEPTARPWVAVRETDPQVGIIWAIQRADGEDGICTISDTDCDATDAEIDANAELIVRCVNSHDDLLAAVKAAVALLSHVMVIDGYDGGVAGAVRLCELAIANGEP